MFELDLSLIVFCGFTIVLFCSVTSISLLHRFFYNKSSIGHANKLDKKRSKSATRTGRLQDEECRTTSSQQSLARRHQEQSKASGAKVTQSCKAEQIEILGPKEPTDADVENPSMGGTMRKIGNMREATASIGNEMIHQLFDGMKKIVDKKQQAKVEDPQHVQELSQVRGMLQELRQKQKGGDMALEEGSFWSSEFPPRQKSLISTHNE
eukprot:gene13153-15532_t